MARKRYQTSESGNYRVELTRVWPHLGTIYKPDTRLIVDQSLLDLMLGEEGLVASVKPSA